MFYQIINSFLSFTLGLLTASLIDKYSKIFYFHFKNNKKEKKTKKEPNENQNKDSLSNSFIIVVGVGGVGSHVVMSLLRSGIKKIRVIDYDTVSLS